jgi:hypothetical protein
MNSIKGKQRIYWLAGFVLVILGVLVTAVLLVTSRAPDPGPHIDVPAMQNVPPAERKLGVEVEKEP